MQPVPGDLDGAAGCGPAVLSRYVKEVPRELIRDTNHSITVSGGRMVIPGNHTVDILAMKYGVPPLPGNPGATLLQLGQLGVFGPFG
jgi:hypothetical protein